jgi:hypothetical protein
MLFINLVADEHFPPRFRDYKGWTNEIVCLALFGYYKTKPHLKRALRNNTGVIVMVMVEPSALLKRMNQVSVLSPLAFRGPRLLQIQYPLAVG